MPNHDHHTASNQGFINKVSFLESTMRQLLLPPAEILNALPISPSSSILDAGAGSGYLTIPAAKQTAGMVTALDMDPRMLEIIETKAQAENITNIKTIQGDICNIPLPENSLDIVLASLILHEVRPLAAALADIYRVLKPQGYFLCLEYEKTASSVKGPPMQIRISSAELKQELEQAGFTVQKHLIPSEVIYIITAQKPSGCLPL